MSRFPPRFQLGRREIGVPGSVFVIAEVSANHLGSLERAIELVRAAAEAGADAVKLQTYTADTMTLDAELEAYRLRSGPWAGRSLYDLYTEAATPWEWHGTLKDAASDLGVEFLSTPFDASAVAFLTRLDVPAFKVASFELVDVPLLRAVGEAGRPVIASTGLATSDEIMEAVDVLATAGCPALALLHCTSAYPALAEEADLLTIPVLNARFGVPVGLSDHSMDVAIPTAAAALGAAILEKHLTLDRKDGGPDAGFSLEPEEFRRTVTAVRSAAEARGSVREGPTKGEEDSLFLRRSLIAVRDIREGTRIEAGWVRSLRPSIGLHPRHLDEVIGRRAAMDISRGTGISWQHLQPEAAG